MRKIQAFFGSIRFRVPLAMILVTAGLVIGSIEVHERRSLKFMRQGEVDAARSALMITESVRESVDQRWEDGIYSVVDLWSILADPSLGEDARLERILSTVPIVNAWQVAHRSAEAGDFTFRPVRRGARNPDNEPGPVEVEALDAFTADPSLEEWWTYDESTSSVRYLRPVYLTESCLFCHGDPKKSKRLWGTEDGTDILGYPMENKKVGDLHGAFEVVRSMAAAEAELDAELAQAWRIGLGVVVATALLVFFLLELMVGKPLSKRINGMRYAEKSQDLSFRLPSRSPSTEIHQMCVAFNGFLEPFHQGLSQVVRAVTGVVTDSTRVASISAETYRAADEQTQQTEQLASAMEEFAITSSEMAETAERTKSFTVEAEQAANDGREVVTEVGQAIEDLAREVQSSADVVIALNEQAETIGSVVDVIREIADQTGLLALNAAIEAARAGESGAGFAVVADEVRALAHRTQESTNQIQAIVNEVTSGTTRAAEAMRCSHGMATESVERSRAAREALDTIARSNQQIANAAAQIATASKEQRDVTAEMSKSITSISSGTRGMCEGATETRESTVRIVSALTDLEEMVRYFNLGTNAFDFDHARTAHRSWMTRLRSFLDGDSTLTEEEVVSHEDCVLGKWYYGDGKANFGHLDAMKRLEEPHIRLHALVGEIRAHERAGERSSAESKLGEVQSASDRIIALIDEVEHVAFAEEDDGKGIELF